MNLFSQEIFSSKIPLVVGITGHRDVLDSDVERITLEITAFFQQLRSDYPHTPIVLLSPLAEGADRLAAETALALGITLRVPLPMPQDLYEQDFETRESLLEFSRLALRADHIFELPVMQESADEVADHGEKRDGQYALVGAYVARFSHILLALWDGLPSNLTGSTAQVVDFKLSGTPYPYAIVNPLDSLETGQVFWIKTRRKRNSNLQFNSEKSEWLFPTDFSGDRQDYFLELRRRIEDFNTDGEKYSDILKYRVPKSAGYIFPEEIIQQLPANIQKTLYHFSVADILSGIYQQRTYSTSFAIFILIFIVVSAQFASYIFIGNPWVILLYLLSLGMAYFLFLRGKKRQLEKRYLDYRALAEGLRIQVFWSMLGIRDLVADNYMRKQKGELDWIRQAIMAWSIPLNFANTASFGDIAIKDALYLTEEHWVKDQLQYFVKSAHREEKRLNQFKTRGNIAFGIGLVLATFEMLFDFFYSNANPLTSYVLLIGVIQISGALIYGYAEKRLFSEHSKQYARMGALFSNAKKHLGFLLDEYNEPKAVDIILQLGKEALIENGDWVLVHRERPMEVPKAG